MHTIGFAVYEVRTGTALPRGKRLSAGCHLIVLSFFAQIPEEVGEAPITYSQTPASTPPSPPALSHLLMCSVHRIERNASPKEMPLLIEENV